MMSESMLTGTVSRGERARKVLSALMALVLALGLTPIAPAGQAFADGAYSITAAASPAAGGSVSIQNAVGEEIGESAAGKLVSVEAIAASGYTFKSVEVKDADGNGVETEEDDYYWGDGVMYNFRMPASAVTVTAVFEGGSGGEEPAPEPEPEPQPAGKTLALELGDPGYGFSSTVLAGKGTTLHGGVKKAVKMDGDAEDGALTQTEVEAISMQWWRKAPGEADFAPVGDAFSAEYNPMSESYSFIKPVKSASVRYDYTASESVAGIYEYKLVGSWEVEGYGKVADIESDPFTVEFVEPVESALTGVASPAEGGTVSFEVGGEAATAAKTFDEVTVVATPKDDTWMLDSVAVEDEDGALAYSPYYQTFKMPSKPVTVTATFAKVVESDIVTARSEHGTVTYSVGSRNGAPATKAKTGDTVYVKVKPERGYAVKGKGVSAVGEDGEEVEVSAYRGTSFTMPACKVNVTVEYEKLPCFEVTKAADADTSMGDISLGRSDFYPGEDIEVAIAPAAGCELDKLVFSKPDGTVLAPSKWEGSFNFTCDVADDGLSATIHIEDYWDLEGQGTNSDLVVTGLFKKVPFKVGTADATVAGKGAVTVSFGEGQTGIAGDTAILKAAPANGYALGNLWVTSDDGAESSPMLVKVDEATFAFAMPASDVSVHATWLKEQTTSVSAIDKCVSYSAGERVIPGSQVFAVSGEPEGSSTVFLEKFALGGIAVDSSTGNVTIPAALAPGVYPVSVVAMNAGGQDCEMKAVRLSFNVKVNPADLTGKAPVLKSATATYDGKAHAPVVEGVTGVKLAAGDFTMTCKRAGKVTNDLTSAGEIEVSVTGVGNCKGASASTTFTIKRAANALSVKSLSPSKSKPSVTVKPGAAGAIAQVANAGKGAISVKNVSKAKAVQKWKVAYVAKTKKVSVTVPKGTKKGVYEVKVSVTADGKVKKSANYVQGVKTVVAYVKVG